MAYIDDWYATNSQVRKILEEVCSAASCTHSRYQHGDSRIQRVEGSSYSREIVNTPGTCTMCRCRVFHEPDAITEDDVLDMAALVESVTTIEQLFVDGGALG